MCSTVFACGGRTDTGDVSSNLGREAPAVPTNDGADDAVSGSDNTDPDVVDGTTPSAPGVPNVGNAAMGGSGTGGSSMGTTGDDSVGVLPGIPPNPVAAPTTTPAVTTSETIFPVPMVVPPPVSTVPHASGCDPVTSGALSVSAFVFSDGTTTAELRATSDQDGWCLEGMAASSGDDYANWGAGFALRLATHADGAETVPVNLAAMGGFALTFDATVQGSRAIRPMITEVNSSDVSAPDGNYEDNAFIWGGDKTEEVENSGSYEVPLAEYQLPSWTTLPEALLRDFDPARVDSLQFMITNNPSDEPTEYSICISNLTLIDACGKGLVTFIPSETAFLEPVLEVSEPEPPPDEPVVVWDAGAAEPAPTSDSPDTETPTLYAR